MPEQYQGLASILWMVVFFAIMYVILILPQRRREKKTKEMLNALQVGQEVITIGGMVGKIINIKDDELVIETSVEKTQIKIKRWAVKETIKPVEA
ncbi:MAG: preprotein translocase subunit YajC [Clostridia bacterium]|nr:preprotein translocase subunit YajC [Clostridia bacterium]